jgi:Na+/proline symporter
MTAGCAAFLFSAVGQFGGWTAILQRVAEIRPEGLAQNPPTVSIELLTLLLLFVQGWFFAGSPNAGEGMTAQRFMTARNESHAVGGQLFNAFLSLSFRTLPLIGLGIVSMSLFLPTDPGAKLGPAPADVTVLTLSSLINWGGSFVVNDLIPARQERTLGEPSDHAGAVSVRGDRDRRRHGELVPVHQLRDGRILFPLA